jgi:hypothetical protein
MGLVHLIVIKAKNELHLEPYIAEIQQIKYKNYVREFTGYASICRI